ncbi:MAG: hypothetical protein WC635_00890 [Bacteriovorax sp.]|jgi:hypothetical protein
MAEPKKKDFEDPVNAKIQHKFDLVFSKPVKQAAASTAFNEVADDTSDHFSLDEDKSMTAEKKPEAEIINVDLDFGEGDGEIDFSNAADSVPEVPVEDDAKGAPRLAVVPDDGDLGFNLDFGDDTPEVPAIPETIAAEASIEGEHFELDMSGTDEEFEIDTKAAKANDSTAEISNEVANDANMFDEAIAMAQENEVFEGTQKTIVMQPLNNDDLKSEELIEDVMDTESFGAEKSGTTASVDLMSTEEAQANIESTIKDILRPKKSVEGTQEIDINALGATDFSDEAPGTSDFDLSSMEFADKEEEAPEEVTRVATPTPKHQAVGKDEPIFEDAPVYQAPSAHASFVSDEESTRFQSTIRQLREERESLVQQIKTLKGETRELEQDNLTLKASLDESKIEVSILRKRHMVEMEDMKYRLAMNEEKKAMAIEAARMAESKREKLEQRVRIDFNQVKQREKELETKLEMLSIDVDSQVQSRDQKILELRRKIDALEFNMENVSIKEQKSQDDKRKLEDKLNKIMKTLRHSIKNLEDDIDQVNEEAEDTRHNEDHRSNKA